MRRNISWLICALLCVNFLASCSQAQVDSPTETASAEEIVRIRTEAEAIAQIQHPAIVQIFDVGEVEELPYLAMEYCAGGTLANRLDGKPILPILAAEWRTSRQASSGVSG